MNYACRIEICSMKLKIGIESGENATRAKPAGGRGRRKMDEREATGDEIHLVLTRRRGRRQPYYIEGSMLYRMGPAPLCFPCFPCRVHSQMLFGAKPDFHLFSDAIPTTRARVASAHGTETCPVIWPKSPQSFHCLNMRGSPARVKVIARVTEYNRGKNASLLQSLVSNTAPDIADMVDSRE